MKSTTALTAFSVLLTLAQLTAVRNFAQTIATAQIVGVVTDSSGAPVPRARVKATQSNTQLVRSTVSGSDGTYVLPSLPVGPYELEVSASGFRTQVQSGLVLQVGNNITIDLALALGAIEQKVTVEANAGMVQTADTSVSQVIDQRRIVELPLNGRQATQLILLSGAAVVTPAGDLNTSKNYPSSTTISVAGGQATGTNYLLDGADNNEAFTNVNMPFPFPDALQEFNVQTSGLSARYGLHPGAVVDVVTKSGGNQIHGDVFEFLRNGVMNARNFFAAKQDTLKRNQFGGAVGGAVIKSKLFYFGGYQGTRNRQAPPTSTVFVPTPASLEGDFSTLESGSCISGGRARPIIDPSSGAPFPNSFVSPSRFNSSAVSLLKYIPTSNDPCGKLIIGIPTTGDEDQAIGRVDWLISQRNSFFGRYLVSDYRNPAVFDGKNVLTTTRPGVLDRGQSAVLSETFAFNPTTINSAHISFSRMRVNRSPAPNMISPNMFGIDVFQAIPHYMTFSVSSYFSGSCGTCARGVFNDNAWQLADDLDFVRGRHHIAVGVQWLHNGFKQTVGGSVNGSFTFNGSASNDGLVDFMLGRLSSFNQETNEEWEPRANYIGLHIDDSFRVNRRLTVNAGLRWEPFYPAADIFGRGIRFNLANFLSGTGSSKFVNAPPGLLFPGDQGVPPGVINNQIASFAPRFGLVFDPTGHGRQTIRTSYGIYNEQPIIYFGQGMGSSPPWGNFLSLTNPVGGFSNPYQGYPGGNPFPRPFPTRDFPFPLSAGNYTVMPPDLHPTYDQQWNLSYQLQLSSDWMLAVNYLGRKTTHLWASVALNHAVYIPGMCNGIPCSSIGNSDSRRVLTLLNPVNGASYGPILNADSGANSEYNGLAVSIQKRFGRQFSLLANYTWSHCIGEWDTNGEEGGSYEDPNNRNASRGNCNYDRRHIFNTSFVASAPRFTDVWKQRFLGDWRFSSIITARSGDFFSATTGTDASLTAVGADRPNLIGDPHPTDQNIGNWMVRGGFQANAPGTYGNLGRDTILGPGYVNFDVELSRSFTIHEGQQLEFRFEAFNIFNHANFNDPTASLSSSNFGKILSAADPRILQLALKIHF
jgi:hypothetical protein